MKDNLDKGASPKVKVDLTKTNPPPSTKKINKRKSFYSSQPWVRRVFLIAFLGWFFAGVWIVSPHDRAVVLRLGKYHGTLTAGFHFFPPLIDHVDLVNVENINELSYQAELLTKDENLVAIKVTVNYQILTPYDFLYRFKDANLRLKLAMASSLNRIVSSTDLENLLSEELNQVIMLQNRFLTKLNAELANDAAAVLINKVSLEPVAPNKAISDVFTTYYRAKEDAKTKINAAEVYKNQVLANAQSAAKKLLADAEIYKQQTVANAKANTEEYIALLAAYKKAPEVTKTRLYLETLDAILSKNKAVLVDIKENGNLHLSLPKAAFEPQLQEPPSNSSPQKPEETAEGLRKDMPSRLGYPKGEAQ